MLVPYEGGPVVYCPLVYTSFWGASWTNSNASLASQLNQFVQDLMQAGPWMNVLTQYGLSGAGALAQSSFLEFVPKTLTVSSYEAIFQSCINAGLIPEPENVNNSRIVSIVLVFLDSSVIINGGGRQLNFPGAPDAGYHDSFNTAAGNPFIYAFSEFADLKTITTIMSHEFAEMVTDPLYTAWTPDQAQHEIGDYCEGQNTTITVGGRTWTVQQMWSDVANACVVGSATRIPPIHPGPFGAVAAAAGAGVKRLGRGPARALDPAEVAPYHRVLPLPPVRFDHRYGTKQIADADMMAYTRKLFSPLRHHHLISDFPGLLRHAATLLESRAATGGAADEAEELEVGGDVSEAAPEPAARRKGVVSHAKG